MRFRELGLQMRGMKHYLIAALGTFVIGLYLGYTNPDSFRILLDAQTDKLQQMQSQISGEEHIQLALFFAIWKNNLWATFIVLYSGILFGLPPLLFLVTNGLLIGYVAQLRVPDMGWWGFLERILAHGVIEIPAILLASAYGLKMGQLVIASLLTFPSPKRRALNGPRFKRFLQLTLPLAVVLLVMLTIAAVLESTVSYHVGG